MTQCNYDVKNLIVQRHCVRYSMKRFVLGRVMVKLLCVDVGAKTCCYRENVEHRYVIEGLEDWLDQEMTRAMG